MASSAGIAVIMGNLGNERNISADGDLLFGTFCSLKRFKTPRVEDFNESLKFN